MSGQDLTVVGERLEHLLEELRMLEPTARQRAEECIRLVTDLYGAGLNNVMELIVDSGDVVLFDKVVRNGPVCCTVTPVPASGSARRESAARTPRSPRSSASPTTRKAG